MYCFCNRYIYYFAFTFVNGSAQPERWQQGAKYEMDIDFDVKNINLKATRK